MQYIMYWFSYAFINDLDGNITVIKAQLYPCVFVCVCVIITTWESTGFKNTKLLTINRNYWSSLLDECRREIDNDFIGKKFFNSVCLGVKKCF